MIVHHLARSLLDSPVISDLLRSGVDRRHITASTGLSDAIGTLEGLLSHATCIKRHTMSDKRGESD
jgi:hypothetical protein